MSRSSRTATVIVGGAVALVLFFFTFVSNAGAHGKHVSPIKPAYDCFFNPDGPDTRGDVVITRDDDLDVYVVWKCQCTYTEMGYLVCYWRHRGQFAKRDRAVRRARELTEPDSKYGPEYLRLIRVSWFARPVGSDGCHRHVARKYAVVVRRRG